MLEKVSFDDPESMRMRFRLTGRRCKSPNNLILGGGGILFTKFQTFDEDDEQDSDSQEVPTICSALRTIHSTCTLVMFTTFLPGIRFNDKNSGKTNLMLIPAPKRNPPRLI